ncbi:MAG: M23 family metallopeptidase [Firmicutes bacterium]|nr:M23 family metallopeptidase [Bacillota bacterium]
MGWQKDKIKDMAKELGIDTGYGNSQLEEMQKIAKEVGMDHFNGLSNADTDELERRLKQRKKEQASLPNGENLSDKINKNKFSKFLQKSNNDPNKKGKTKTGLPDTQGLGTAAAKEALKKAADVVPYTKWIPKGIRDKIIDKFMDSKLGQSMVEREIKKVKMSLILLLVSVVGSFLFSLFMVCAILTLILSPVAFIQDVLASVGDFFLSLGNFVIGNGWCSSEEECQADLRGFYYSDLKAHANDYKEQCGNDLNQELITATIFYDRMVTFNSSDMPSGEQFDSDNIEEDTYYKYNNYDVSEISDLIFVYKNRNSAATCGLSKVENIMTDLKNIFEGEYDAKAIDDFFNEYKPKILGAGSISDLSKELSDLVGGKTDLWQEIITEARKNLSCFDYVFNIVTDLFKSEEEKNKQQCTFNEDNYKNYLINYYIPQHYAYLTKGKYSMTYEKIANEIVEMGNNNNEVGGDSSSSSSGIVVSGGEAGLIPQEILQNIINPVGTQNLNHTSCFGFYDSTNCGVHNGIDIGGSGVKDPKIYSIADGVVDYISKGNDNCRPDFSASNICHRCTGSATGNKVRVKHSMNINGKNYVFYSEYLHLKSIDVDKNQKVVKGQQVGIMGNTGCSTGVHLHFSMLDENFKRYNPEEVLKQTNANMLPDCEDIRQACYGR